MALRGNTKIIECIRKAKRKVFTKSFFDKLAKEMADTVRVRAQLGGSVSEQNKGKKPFKKLSESYKLQRAGKLAFFTNANGQVIPITNPKRKPKLSDLTTPNKSNITRTGQLIESITGKASSGGFEIELAGKRTDSPLTNDEVGKFVKEQGRPFLNLSNVELKKLTRIIEEALATEINKCLNK